MAPTSATADLTWEPLMEEASGTSQADRATGAFTRKAAAPGPEWGSGFTEGEFWGYKSGTVDQK